MWAPRPPGHRHQFCSRPACGQDQAQRDTTAGITVLPRMHGRAPWTTPPAGRRATVGREVWGGSAAWTDSLQLGYSNSSASQRLLGLKSPPAPPGEEHDGDGALKVTEKRHNWIFFKGVTTSCSYRWDGARCHWQVQGETAHTLGCNRSILSVAAMLIQSSQKKDLAKSNYW